MGVSTWGKSPVAAATASRRAQRELDSWRTINFVYCWPNLLTNSILLCLLLTLHYQKHTTEVCDNCFKFPRTTAPIARDLTVSLIFCSSGIGQTAQNVLEGPEMKELLEGTKENNIHQIAVVVRPVADLPPYRPRLSSHCSDWRLISWKLSAPFGGGGGGFKSEVAWKAGLVVAEGTFRGNELEWLLCKDLKIYSFMNRNVPYKWELGDFCLPERGKIHTNLHLCQTTSTQLNQTD